MSISEHMAHEHRQCDAAFARAEDAVSSGDWAAAQAAFLEEMQQAAGPRDSVR